MSIPFNNKKQQLQYINLCIGAHDLVCDCQEPGFHSLKLLANQIGRELQPEQKKEIQKCLGITTGEDHTDIDNIDIGDLEKLFEEDITEDDSG